MTQSTGRLNADDLGELGEAIFKRICASASLICNKSGRDRAGWDFLVQFPLLESSENRPVDTRAAPISARFQTKAMWVGNDVLKIRLTMAERLAKDLNPAFLFVVKVDEKHDAKEIFLIHIMDGVLASILKRLREQRARGNLVINNKFITFRTTKVGLALPSTSEAFRTAVQSLCGASLKSYFDQKERQLRSLGFEPHPIQAEATFLVKNYQELADIFLGLRRGEVSDWKAFETRFGIRLPLHESIRGTIQIQPGRADECTISVHDITFSAPAVFKGEIFLPPIPEFPQEYVKMIAKTKFFTFVISPPSAHFETHESAMNEGEFTSEEWINVCRMLAILCEGTGAVRIIPKTLSGQISFPININVDDDARGYRWAERAFQSAKTLFELAGAFEPKFQYADVVGQAQEIIAASELFRRPQEISPLTFRTTDYGSTRQKHEAIYVNFIVVAGVTFAYFALVQVKCERNSEGVNWFSENIEPREIAILANLERDYDGFIEKAKTSTGMTTVIVGRVAPGGLHAVT
jgi:hypothetical protein